MSGLPPIELQALSGNTKAEQPKQKVGGMMQICSNYFAPKGIHTLKDALLLLYRAATLPVRAALMTASFWSSLGLGATGALISNVMMGVAAGMDLAGLDSKHRERTRGVAFELNKVFMYLGSCALGGWVAGLECLASGNFNKEQFHASLTRSLALNHLVSLNITKRSATVTLSKDFKAAQAFFNKGWNFLIHQDEQGIIFKSLTAVDISKYATENFQKGGLSGITALAFFIFGEILHKPASK